MDSSELFAVSPTTVKRNFLRKIYEYQEIVNEMQWQSGEGRTARLEETFGKEHTLAMSRYDQAKRTNKPSALLELDLAALWCADEHTIKLLAMRKDGNWEYVAAVGKAPGGRTRYEVEGQAPSLLLKRWTPAKSEEIVRMRRRRNRGHGIYCGTNAGWSYGPCAYYQGITPQHLATTVRDACEKLESWENAPVAFRQDAIMFAREIDARTQVFGHLIRRYLRVAGDASNPFNSLVNYGGEFGQYQFNMLLQVPYCGLSSGLRIMASTPPANWSGLPDILYWTIGSNGHAPERPKYFHKAPGSLVYPKTFLRMGDALSHIMEWCASTVEVPC